VETKEQEAARLRAEAARAEKVMPQTTAATSSSDGGPADDAGEGEALVLEPQADLITWQADDAEAKAKKGDRVTNDHLRLIAGRESVLIETDDNKTDLQQKIMAARAERAAAPATVS